ncbi:MAG: GNAT family N-acetyltransferase [Acidobacteriota bacterium]|nr:GNAT family N-acetyltransferase [Acidobacteriota bacterium]MDH3529017.1 GNAT family N-acetyltransferase [Acidobacteriota bacterium]
MDRLIIRKAKPRDYEGIWNIIRAVISTGEFYAFRPGTPKEVMLGYWCGSDKHTYVAEIETGIAGTFIIKDNQPGLGSHIANASFMTSPNTEGRGIGTSMGRFCLDEARALGYSAIQFNLVVKSNDSAVRLWKRLGFQIIGEIPDAFDHTVLGLTNAYIMYQKL